jgi:hypothetical protein
MTIQNTPHVIYSGDYRDLTVRPFKSGQAAFIDLRAQSFIRVFNDQPKVVAARGGAKLGEMAAHHIIPLEFVRGKTPQATRVFEMMKALTNEGLFSVLDGHQNLMWLPNNQTDANATGLTLHTNIRPQAFHADYSAKVGKALKFIDQNDIYRDPVTNQLDYTNHTGLEKAAADIAGLQAYLEAHLVA